MNKNWVGFDTETTGIDIYEDRIITAAIVDKDKDGIVDAEELTINPHVEIPEGSIRVHGITNEFVAEHGKEATEVLPALVKKLDEADVIVAYNGAYDLGILDNELKRNGYGGLDPRIRKKLVDPLVIDRHFDRWRKGGRTLEKVAAHYGVEVEGDLHDATTDVIVTLGVLDAIIEKYPEVGNYTGEELYERQRKWHKTWADGFNNWKKEVVINPEFAENGFKRDKSTPLKPLETSTKDSVSGASSSNANNRAFHLSPDGVVRPCEANVQECEYEHFGTQEEGEKSFQEKMSSEEISSITAPASKDTAGMKTLF